MVKIVNPLGDVKVGRQGEVVYQRKRAMASEAQVKHRELYRQALTWRSNLALANRRYLDGYCIANGVVDDYQIPLPWSRFALKLYLEKVRFIAKLETVGVEEYLAEKKDSSRLTTPSGNWFGKTRWKAQTIEPIETYPIGKLKCYLAKDLLPNTITVGIRRTDANHHPTGEDLTSGTYDGNTLNKHPAVSLAEIDFATYWLQKGIEYAIVMRAPDAWDTSDVNWYDFNTNTEYPRGQIEQSSDSGQTWTPLAYDENFEVWSAYVPSSIRREGLLHVRHPALLRVSQERNGVSINGYDTLSSLDDEYLTKQVGLDVVGGDVIEATTLPGIEYRFLVSETIP
ncbi:hypothetical protein ES703_114059 [subsurface metagenome]